MPQLETAAFDLQDDSSFSCCSTYEMDLSMKAAVRRFSCVVEGVFPHLIRQRYDAGYGRRDIRRVDLTVSCCSPPFPSISQSFLLEKRSTRVDGCMDFPLNDQIAGPLRLPGELQAARTTNLIHSDP